MQMLELYEVPQFVNKVAETLLVLIQCNIESRDENGNGVRD